MLGFPSHRSASLGVAALWLVVGAYAGYVIWMYAAAYGAVERGERPLYTDFTPTYAAALVLRELPADYLYHPRAMDEAARETAKIMYGDRLTTEQVRALPFTPWLYPPTFNFILEPLARMPYLLALLFWFVVTLPPYIMLAQRLARTSTDWLLFFAAPPVFLNVMYGQTGFLSAGLLGLGFCLLRERALLAGLMIGLASLKPHLGILVPLALAAGGHWRAFAAASLTVVILVGASVITYGLEPWLAYAAQAGFHLDGFSVGAYNFYPMVSVLAALRNSGVSLEAAWISQFAIAAVMSVVVAFVWRKGRQRVDTQDLQSAVLVLAILLSVPMAYLYDLVLLVPVGFWLWRAAEFRPASRFIRCGLLASMASLIAAKPLAEAVGFQFAGFIVLAWFALALMWFIQGRDVRCCSSTRAGCLPV